MIIMFGGKLLIMLVDVFVLVDMVLIFVFNFFLLWRILERFFKVFDRLLFVFDWIDNMMEKKFNLGIGMCVCMFWSVCLIGMLIFFVLMRCVNFGLIGVGVFWEIRCR